MRKLAVAAALAFAALSWAHGAHADDAAQKSKDAAGAVKAETKQGAREAQGSMERGAARMRDSARTTASAEEKQHPLFGGKSNFDVEGKVQKVSGSSITVQRDQLPPATLEVSKSTKVELDGEAASMKQLKPGQDVKASFNLRGDKPEAVEIKAKKSDQQKDAEKSGQTR